MQTEPARLGVAEGQQPLEADRGQLVGPLQERHVRARLEQRVEDHQVRVVDRRRLLEAAVGLTQQAVEPSPASGRAK